jgi:activator of HSP90 ATPase
MLEAGHGADSIRQNKNCRTWAHDWVKRSLPGLKVHGDGIDAEVTEITNVSGDCDLGQRKGK